MAAINISVSDGLFEIQLDQYEWTGLTVNGEEVPFINNQWTFNQTSSGLIEFSATGNLTVTNPGNCFVLSGEEDDDYVCIVNYSKKGDPFELKGVLLPAINLNGAQPGPFSFTQGMMVGSFYKD